MKLFLRNRYTKEMIYRVFEIHCNHNYYSVRRPKERRVNLLLPPCTVVHTIILFYTLCRVAEYHTTLRNNRRKTHVSLVIESVPGSKEVNGNNVI